MAWAEECHWAAREFVERMQRRFPFFVRVVKDAYYEYDPDMLAWVQDRGLVSGDDFVQWEPNAFIFAKENDAALFKLQFG